MLRLTGNETGGRIEEEFSVMFALVHS